MDYYDNRVLSLSLFWLNFRIFSARSAWIIMIIECYRSLCFGSIFAFLALGARDICCTT